jgi:plastocyanin
VAGRIAHIRARGCRWPIVALAAPLAALVLTAPDRAAAQSTWDVQARDDAGSYWAPDELDAEPSDTVRWAWDEATIDHNVFIVPPGEDPQLLSPIQTPPGAPPVTYEPTESGVYRFYCSLHGTPTAGMAGVVNVGVAGGGGGPEPLPNPTGPPTELEHGDNERPKLSNLRVKGLRGAVRVRFRTSEPGKAKARFLRRRGGGRGKPAGRVTIRGLDAGTVRKRVSDGGLEPGRYRVELRAFDRAGNRSKRAGKGVRIRG